MASAYFFLPEPDAVLQALPTSIADYWKWQGEAVLSTPYWGRYHWVLQSFLYLKQDGVDIRLVNSLPDAGVIITHVDCVDYGFRPSKTQFFVALLVDREIPHPWGDLHVLHNPVQQLHLGLDHCYMPPWPQIGLIPRDRIREERFETLGYFGYPHNLHPDLSQPSFLSELESLGLHMVVPPPASWHDFSDVDCILAIRDFGRKQGHLNKPSLKLLNAWLAGVPAVLGHELAYRAEGHPGSGYLEATSAEEVLTALRLLRTDRQRRRSLVEFGAQAVQAFSVARTVGRWRQLLDRAAVAAEAKATRGHLRASSTALAGAVRERVLWRRPGWFQ